MEKKRMRLVREVEKAVRLVERARAEGDLRLLKAAYAELRRANDALRAFKGLGVGE
jgi:hypothetical protein